MVITSSSISSLQGIIQPSDNAGGNTFSQSPSVVTGSDTNISPFAKMASNMSGLSADERAQAQAFRDEMRSAMRGGDFNPEEMAQKAPDFMKQRAEENGVSLTDVFQQIEDRVSALRNLSSSYSFGSMLGGNEASNSQLLESFMSALSGGDEKES
mgnify:CR=1 FL=1